MLLEGQKQKALNINWNQPSLNSIAPKTLDLIIVGCGTIGGALIKQINEQQKILAARNLPINVLGIANQKGILLDPAGVDLSCWQENIKNVKGRYNLAELSHLVKRNNIANPVIVDCTGSREFSLTYPDILEHGFNIVTANKIANGEPIAFYKKIRQLAEANNKRFLYETNIGAGLPVIDPFKKLILAGDKLNRFEGILSGSLSYIFGEIHKGKTISEATISARELGFTEPDPRDDLSGMDVARKVLIIAREAGLEIELTDINVEPILPEEFNRFTTTEEFLTALSDLDTAFSVKVADAEKEGAVLRYVATIEKDQCRVAVEKISSDNPLHEIDGGENILAFYTRYYDPKPLLTRGYGAGPDVTAAGVFGDILRLVN
jgi:bifunctional aspartokinase / homoserine dehydrogenase 1